jgi:hypothetical protein
MTLRPEADTVPEEQLQRAMRRPWHAPAFYLADVESTEENNQGNPDNQGGASGMG